MLRFSPRVVASLAVLLPVFAACGEGSNPPFIGDSPLAGSDATDGGTRGHGGSTQRGGADSSGDDTLPSDDGGEAGSLSSGKAGGGNGGSADNAGSGGSSTIGGNVNGGSSGSGGNNAANAGAGGSGGASAGGVAGGEGTAGAAGTPPGGGGGGGAPNGAGAGPGGAGGMGAGGMPMGGMGAGGKGSGGSGGMGGKGAGGSGGMGGKGSGGSGGAGGKGSGGSGGMTGGSGGSDGTSDPCFDSLPPTGSGQAEDKLGAANTWVGLFSGRIGAISGHTAVLGSQGNPLVVGKAAIFQWNDCTSAWELQQVVVGSDTKADEYFGGTVELAGDSLVVGASYRSGLAGGAYTFTRSGTTWTQGQILSPPTAAARFGYAISQFGSTMAISAPLGKDPTSAITYSGEVYIYTRGPGGKWSYQVMLSPAELASDDLYGYSLELDSGTLVAGAPGRGGSGAWNQGKTPGKAWLWTGSGSTWTQGAYLTPSDGQNGDSFGNAVAIEGDTLVIGAPYHDATAANAGAAYVFTKTGNAWVQTAKLTASDAGADALFGYSATLVSSTHLLVGAPGAAKLYSFTYTGSSWTEDTDKYSACNGTIGHNVTVSGNLALSSHEGGWIFDLTDPDKSCVGP